MLRPTQAQAVLCPLLRDDNVQRELRDWGLSFDSNLLSFSGRILQAEKIHQGGKTVRPLSEVPVSQEDLGWITRSLQPGPP